MIDRPVSVLQCKNCNSIVRILFESGHDDDRRHSHDHPDWTGLTPKQRREGRNPHCPKLEPVEVGREGLLRKVQQGV